jgi:hypothetical protein
VQLPGPGEVADFDELVALLAAVGAHTRLVSDPLPFLATTTPPLDRCGARRTHTSGPDSDGTAPLCAGKFCSCSDFSTPPAC